MTFTELTQGVDYRTLLYLNKASAGNFTLHLYTSNHTPAVGDTNTTYTTIECSLTGYSAHTFAPGDWTGSTTAGVSTYATAGVVFTFSAYAGGTTIYGAYLQNGAGDVIAAALLDTSFAVPTGGGSVTITPTVTMKQC
jgi:hypothetical protein